MRVEEEGMEGQEVEGVAEHGDGRWQAERKTSVGAMEMIGGKRKG